MKLLCMEKGLNSFMIHCLPNITWTEGYYSSFQNILARLLKLFKHLQKDSNVRDFFPCSERIDNAWIFICMWLVEIIH